MCLGGGDGGRSKAAWVDAYQTIATNQPLPEAKKPQPAKQKLLELLTKTIDVPWLALGCGF